MPNFLIYNLQGLANNVFLQASQSLLRCLQYVIVLANGKAQIIFSDMSVGISVKLGRWDGSNTDFLDKEPRKLEIARTVGDMWWEGVVLRKMDGSHVGEDEIATFRIRVLSRLLGS